MEWEPKHLVDGIAVTAVTYEETKRILHTKYGDENRIIQAHLDYLEDLKPIRSATPELLNTTYVECNRRLQALRALGENIDNYGRILAPKILRAFPDDICRLWIIHAMREQLSEGEITKIMAFLNEEVEGEIITRKIRVDVTGLDPSPRQLPSMSTQSPPNQILLNQKVDKNHSACSVKIGPTGLKTAKKLQMSRIGRRS